MPKNVVLDKSLYEQYHLFKIGADSKDYSKDTIIAILRFSGNSVLTNYRQWHDLKYPEDEALTMGLHKDGKRKDLNLEELAAHTVYKIILTEDSTKTSYPYVNIHGDEIDMVLGGFVMKDAPRQKAIKHIAALCRNAKDVTIYDRYFSKETKVDSNIQVLKDILPSGRKLNITYHKNVGETHLTSDCITKIQADRPDWTFADRNLPEHHDRYLILDSKTEIILTSGFDNLSSTARELSYIVRPCPGASRF